MNGPHRFYRPPARRAGGFSLVELLVGVAIGMVGLMVIFKTVATWDIHSRSTTAGGEAESTGTLAMFNLERDIKQAGIGISEASAAQFGCQVRASDTGGGSVPARSSFTFTLAPVSLAAAGPSDTISVLQSNSAFFVEAATFSASTGTGKTIAPADIERRSGFRAGDLAVAVSTDGTACQLLQITDTAAGLGQVLTHAPGAYTDFYGAAAATARYNSGTAVTFAAGGSLFSLGPNPQQNTWAVGAGSRLTRIDNLHADQPSLLADGVVAIKAQYGVDVDSDNRIADTEWTAALPVSTPPAWSRVRAVRVAILVRSKQYERSTDPEAGGQAVGVTLATPTWAGSADHPFTMTNVDGTTDSLGPNDASPNNWRFYRYRVYEKQIPIRNMIWASAPPS